MEEISPVTELALEVILILMACFFITIGVYPPAFYYFSILLPSIVKYKLVFLLLGMIVLVIAGWLRHIIRAIKLFKVTPSFLALLTSDQIVRNGIYFLFSTLFVYSLGLMLLKPYNPRSYYYIMSGFFYHLLLIAFVVLYVLLKAKVKLKELGFSKGNLKEGFFWISQFIIIIMVVMFSATRVFQKAVTITWAFMGLALFEVIWAPVTEEIFHRGFLQTKLEEGLGSTYGLILASLIFAITHIPKMLFASEHLIYPFGLPTLSATPIQFIGILYLAYFFLAGLYFGFVYRSTKSVGYSIVLHSLFNFLAIFIIVG